MSTFKIIVAGSRGFTDYKHLEEVLDSYMEEIPLAPIEIVSGGARGADTLGQRYAHEHSYKLSRFIPDWETHGKSAGFIRNAEMGRYADALVAFHDGESRGTTHMIDFAKSIGLDVVIVKYKEVSDGPDS